MADQVNEERGRQTSPSLNWNCLNEDIIFYIKEGDDWANKTVKDIFEKRRVLVITLPGAFTPTCSNSMVPDYEKMYDDLKTVGRFDDIYVMSVNDTFVMNAWFKQLGIKKLKALPDGNTSFTKRLFMDVGLDEAGMGLRSKRGVFLFQGGTLGYKWVEADSTEKNPDPYTSTTPDSVFSTILGQDNIFLRANQEFGGEHIHKAFLADENLKNVDIEGIDFDNPETYTDRPMIQCLVEAMSVNAFVRVINEAGDYKQAEVIKFDDNEPIGVRIVYIEGETKKYEVWPDMHARDARSKAQAWVQSKDLTIDDIEGDNNPGTVNVSPIFGPID